MFAKLATVVVVLGAMFGALLVNRQQRIDAASEMSRLHFEIERNERERIRLEAEIATAVRPDRIAALLRKLDLGIAVEGPRRLVKNGIAVETAGATLRPIPFRENPKAASDEALSALEFANDADAGAAGQELGG